MIEHPHAIPNQWLTLYYDSELDASRREQVEAHLATCAVCQRELAALKALSSTLAVDQLADSAVTSPPTFWHKLEPQLPDRAPVTLSPVRWLPGIGLLLINGLAQFGAAVSVVVILVAGQLPWATRPATWLGRAILGWMWGWPAWLLPAQWSDLGAVLFFVVVSAWLAVLYLAWLGYVWRSRWQPAMRPTV
jgi:anti-sigma factor RsiW